MIKKIFFLILPFTIAFISKAQNTYTIQLDGKGKLFSDLPEKLLQNDKLQFHLSDPDESFDTYKKQLQERLIKAKSQLLKLLADEEKKKLLKDVYDIDAAEITNVKNEIQSVITDISIDPSTLRYLSNFKNSDKYFHVAFSNTSTSQKDDFNPNTISSALAVTLSPYNNELDISITKDNPYKKLVFNWLANNTNNANAGGQVNFDQIKADKEKLQNFLDGNLKPIQKFLTETNDYFNKKKIPGHEYSPADISTLDKITKDANNFALSVSGIITPMQPDVRLPNYKTWILNWLWYQSTVLPALNPLPFRSADDLDTEPDTTELISYRYEIAARDTFLKEMDMKKFSVKQIDSFVHETDFIKRLADDLVKKYQQYSLIKNKNESAKQDFTATSSQLNKPLFLISNTQNLIYWMRHHNASDNNNLMSNIATSEYLETDKVVILSHNLLPNQKSEIHFSLKDITDDQSRLTEALKPIIEQLTPLLKNAPPITPAPLSVVLTATDQAKNKANDAVNTLANQIKDAKQLLLEINYLSTQHIPFVDVKETKDVSNSYHTQIVNPAKKVEGPKKATYYLNTVSTDKSSSSTDGNKPAPDTFSYRINKLYRLFPLAGISYTFNRFNTITQDSSSHQSKNTEDPHLHFIIGLKVYLRKTDIRSSKVIFADDGHGKNNFLSRTSINVAFDATKPLNNIYTGLGLDIWPGFCINFGSVVNKYAFNVYSNGQTIQTKNLYRPGFYVGISTDLSLFTDITKLLNLSK